MRRARQAGFTLLELMVSGSILAIMAALATPAFNTMIVAQRLKNASNDMYSSLVVARSEAIKRNTSVTVAPVTTGSWESGWNTTAIVSSTLAVVTIQKHGALASSAVSGPTNVVFNSTGRISGSAPSFNFSVTGSAQHRCITADLSGRPVISPTACPS